MEAMENLDGVKKDMMNCGVIEDMAFDMIEWKSKNQRADLDSHLPTFDVNHLEFIIINSITAILPSLWGGF